MGSCRLCIGLVLIAVASMAFSAGDAWGATELKTEKASWEVGETLLTEPTPLRCSQKGESGFVFTSKVGGVTLEVTARGVECKETTIFNESIVEPHMAVGTGSLIFTGMKVVKPSTCSTPSTLTSEIIKSKIEMHLEGGVETPRIFTLTEPASGTKLASMKLTGSECSIASTVSMTGQVVGESTTETGQLVRDMPLIFNAATNELGTLKIDGQSAKVTGEIKRELETEKEFRVTDK